MRNYKICRITGINYPDALDKTIDAARQAGAADYQSILDDFLSRGTIYGNGFTLAMAQRGHETMEILFNATELQKLWAEENGITYDEDDALYQIAIAQMKAFRPDVVYIQGGTGNTRVQFVARSDFRRECPSVRSYVAYVGFPVDTALLQNFDLVLSGTPLMWTEHRQAGANAHLVYHAFDARLLDRLKSYQAETAAAVEAPRLSFIGSTGYGYGPGHMSRYWDLTYLLLTTELQIWGYEPKLPHLELAADDMRKLSEFVVEACQQVSGEEVFQHLIGLHQRSFKSLNPLLPLSQVFPTRCHAPVYGLEMYDLLARSQMTFNRHTDAAEGCVANMRLYEATGVGGCLVTDNGFNMRDLFEPDEEVVVYNSIPECLDKVRYLMNNPEECRRIAEAGQRRTLRDHTVEKRAEEIDDLIQKQLAMA